MTQCYSALVLRVSGSHRCAHRCPLSSRQRAPAASELVRPAPCLDDETDDVDAGGSSRCRSPLPPATRRRRWRHQFVRSSLHPDVRSQPPCRRVWSRGKLRWRQRSRGGLVMADIRGFHSLLPADVALDYNTRHSNVLQKWTSPDMNTFICNTDTE